MKKCAVWLSLVFLLGCSNADQTEVLTLAEEAESFESLVDEVPVSGERQTAFSDLGLKTNTAISSIPLTEVLSGLPRKDMIPAINTPHFETVDTAASWLQSEGLGVLYQQAGEYRYYPYAILYWHEIVNDQVGDANIAVTFCPLCGSALVFDRVVGDEVLSFGVSGKLWESNLLMYDQKTETLWSQILGRAVVGDRTGDELTLLESDVISFAQLQEHFPQAQVLSRKTGHRRDYDASPYGNYEEEFALMFRVNNLNEQFHPKTLFHIVNFDGGSIGFHREDLRDVQFVEFRVNDQKISARFGEDGKVTVTGPEGERIPDYVAMWFSWVTHQHKPKVVWSAEGVERVE